MTDAHDFKWHQIDLLRAQASSLEARGAIFLATQTVVALGFLASLAHGSLAHGTPHVLGWIAGFLLTLGIISAAEMVLPGRHALPDMFGFRALRKHVPSCDHDCLAGIIGGLAILVHFH